MHFYVGQRLKRRAKGNMSSRQYGRIEHIIVEVTSVSEERIMFKRADGGELDYTSNSISYAETVWKPADIIYLGGE